MSKFETRTFDCKVESDESNKIVGYGSVFDKRSVDLGGFREIIAPGAFDGRLEDDCRALFNHNPDFVLGRTTAGTLALSTDDNGLRYDIDPPETSWAQDLMVSMRRGDISQSSFGFRVGDDDWIYDEESDTVIRTVNRVEILRDVSVVTYPAYEASDSSVRSMNALLEARNDGDMSKIVSHRSYRERFLKLLNS